MSFVADATKAAAECIAANEGRSEPNDQDRAHAEWAVAGITGEWAKRKALQATQAAAKPATRREGVVGNIDEVGPTALGGPPDVLREQARTMGFTGDCCTECGNFKMVQNGTCLKCMECGATNGCS